jgi:hypothetical protein
MSKESWFNALCYEAGLWAVTRWPSLAFSPWFKRLMEHCRPDWTEWKTKIVMETVDKQTVSLQEQWEKEHRAVVAEELAHKAQELFPASKISPLPHAIIPSVLIETAPSDNASEAVKALGGELRITYQLKTPYQLPRQEAP